MKPHHLALGFGALGGILLFAFFPIYPAVYQQASIASAATTPSVSLAQNIYQTKEGANAVIRVKLETPIESTTRVCVRFTPDTGTTSRDFVNPGCAMVTFYEGGLTQKSVLLKTVNTATVGNESVTARIDTVNGVKVTSPSTARILIADKTSKPNDTGNGIVGNIGNPNNTGTATTTTALPPTNCAQYAGVIPGETRKLRVQQGALPSWTLNRAGGYSISSEAQTQLAQMQGDYAFLVNSVRGETLDGGIVYAYQFKTTEYNQTPGDAWLDMTFGPNVKQANLIPSATVMASISECPGDFTSPRVTAQTSGYDHYNYGNFFGDQKFRNCVTFGPVNGDVGGTNINVAVRGKHSNSSNICLLDENKTYYLNITAGFVYGDPNVTPAARYTPYIGTMSTPSGTVASPGVVAMVRQIWPRGYLETARSTFEFIKNKSAFYAERKRLEGEFAAVLQRRVADCRAAIARAMAANGGVRPNGGGECNGLPVPLSPFY